MAQPGNVPPPLEPSPFGRPAETPRPARSGCGRAALIGCGALLVLLGICAVIFFMNAQRFAGRMLSWSFGKLETQIFANMAPDVPQEERERLRTAFRDALAAASSGKGEPKNLQAIQGEVMQIAQRGKGQVSRADVRRLTEALEAVAGKGASPGGGAEPTGRGTEPPAGTDRPPT
jgi:hypothetical protein